MTKSHPADPCTRPALVSLASSTRTLLLLEPIVQRVHQPVRCLIDQHSGGTGPMAIGLQRSALTKFKRDCVALLSIDGTCRSFGNRCVSVHMLLDCAAHTVCRQSRDDGSSGTVAVRAARSRCGGTAVDHWRRRLARSRNRDRWCPDAPVLCVASGSLVQCTCGGSAPWCTATAGGRRAGSRRQPRGGAAI